MTCLLALPEFASSLLLPVFLIIGRCARSQFVQFNAGVLHDGSVLMFNVKNLIKIDISTSLINKGAAASKRLIPKVNECQISMRFLTALRKLMPLSRLNVRFSNAVSLTPLVLEPINVATVLANIGNVLRTVIKRNFVQVNDLLYEFP